MLGILAITGSAQSQQLSSADSDKLAEARRLAQDGKRLFQEGRLPEALVPVKQSLAIKEKILGQNHRSVATTLYSLGSISLVMNDLEVARKYYSRALKICEKTANSSQPDNSKEVDTVAVLDSLAECNERESDWGKAESFHQRALALRQSQLGAQHTDVGQTLLNLTAVQIEKKSYDKAEQSIQQALEVFEKSLGKRHQKYAEVLDTYCWMLYQIGREAEANQKLEEVNEVVFNNAADKTAPLEFLWRSFRGRQIKKKGGLLSAPATGSKVATFHYVLKAKVWVDENGSVTNLQTLSRPIKATQKLEQAIKSFTFRPATVNGKPVKMIGLYVYFISEDVFFSLQ